MVALSPVAPTAMRQESVVEIDERRVTVVSEALTEPELLIVTTVLEGADCIKKSHLVLPTAVARDYEARGPAALAASLQIQHLRYVRRLLSRDDARTDTAPGEVGVLATLSLGPAGEVVRRGGEEHVPGAWLRLAWVVGDMAEKLGETLALGRLVRAELHGADITAVITRDAAAETLVRFLDPRARARGDER